MKMRTDRTSWRVVAPLGFAVCVLAGLAPVMQHKSDNFNNNALAGFWSPGATGNVNVGEINQRLEFRRTGNTGMLSSAGVLFEPHGINWKKDFHVEWTYRFKLNNVAGGRQIVMGTAFVLAGNFPDTMTGFFCGLLRDGPLLHVALIEYGNGSIVNVDIRTITQTTGRIEIDWDKSADTLFVRRNNDAPVTLSGIFANHGVQYGNTPMAITQGVITLNGNIGFVGNNVYMDNWKADYFKRNFP